MLNKLKGSKLLKTLLPLLVGILFIYLSLNNTTAEDRETIYNAIKSADYRFILLSLIMGLLSHFSRAYRWRFMLNPMGYNPRYINSVLAIFITYIANLGVPRSGELFRATALQTYENVPFEKSFGTIIAERTIDLIMLLLTIVVALFLEFDLIVSFLEKRAANPYSITAILIGSIVSIYFFYKQIKKSKNPLAEKITTLFNGLSEGFLTIVKMEKKAAYLLHTLFIWAMYIAMFYTIKFSIPETQSLVFEALLIGFIVGALTISAKMVELEFIHFLFH